MALSHSRFVQGAGVMVVLLCGSCMFASERRHPDSTIRVGSYRMPELAGWQERHFWYAEEFGDVIYYRKVFNTSIVLSFHVLQPPWRSGVPAKLESVRKMGPLVGPDAAVVERALGRRILSASGWMSRLGGHPGYRISARLARTDGMADDRRMWYFLDARRMNYVNMSISYRTKPSQYALACADNGWEAVLRAILRERRAATR